MLCAIFPSRGCETTPPADPTNESTDNTVARCSEGIRPLIYAERMGIAPANIKDQRIITAIAKYKFETKPKANIHKIDIETQSINIEERFLKYFLTLGTRKPPIICAAAASEAVRPEIQKAFSSPYNLSK